MNQAFGELGDAEPMVLLAEMHTCNGTTVAGGHIAHSRRCPVHGETRQPLQHALTIEEHEAMELTAELANRLSRIVGQGPSRAGDIAELVAHLHAIQQAILAQAAGRHYPDRYRLLGETLVLELRPNSLGCACRPTRSGLGEEIRHLPTCQLRHQQLPDWERELLERQQEGGGAT